MKYAPICVFFKCFVKLGFMYSLTRAVQVVYPLLVYFTMFGYQGILEYFWDNGVSLESNYNTLRY